MEGRLGEEGEVACEYGTSGNKMQTMLMRDIVDE
jgi:hypothetical protein